MRKQLLPECRKKAEILRKCQAHVTADKTQLHAGVRDDQSVLEAKEMSFRWASNVNNLGSLLGNIEVLVLK